MYDQHLEPGDRCLVYFRLDPDHSPMTFNVFVILAIAKNYWYWPGWIEADTGFDFRSYFVDPACPETEVILDFTWPVVSGSFDDMFFLAAALDELNAEVIGDITFLPFEFSE